LYAVYFTGPDDARVADSTAQFENTDGSSLDPDVYQMSLMPYQSWLAHDGPGHLSSDVFPTTIDPSHHNGRALMLPISGGPRRRNGR
jgi:hypothetical protein